MIAVAPGQLPVRARLPGRLGCRTASAPGSQDPDGDGIYTFETTALPHGSYEAKVAINEGWDENYGAGGVPNGSNIAVHRPVRQREGHLQLRRDLARAHDHCRRRPGAPGGPGALSHFDLARKDCLGTARNTTSKVWYTVANGVLSDVYYPTVDNTNVETLQYVVTDGATFTDLQTRDMTYTAEAVTTRGGMACKVTATARSGKYRIETDVRHRPEPEHRADAGRASSRSQASGLQLYVRFDPTVNGNGGGGAGNGGADSATDRRSTGHPVLVASDPVTATNAANRDYAQPVFAALDGAVLAGVAAASSARRATASSSSTARTR